MPSQPAVVEPEYLLAEEFQFEVECCSQPIAIQGRP